MFTAYPTYRPLRTLALTSPIQRGEDVYALQTALNEAGFPCGEADGLLGEQTAKAIREAQVSLDLVVDGLAGGATQKGLALRLARVSATRWIVPISALRGQLELESGFRLGNYSPQRSNGSYDAGVAQRNTQFTPPQEGFDAQKSIHFLSQSTRQYFDLFVGVSTLQRRWGLAQGAWNAPAYACYLAREEGATQVSRSLTAQPSAESRETLEAYIRHASVYLSV